MGAGLTETVENICLAAFIFLMAMPGVYGVHLYVLMLISHRSRKADENRHETLRAAFLDQPNWPRVVTQIPLYNERTVARRIIDAVAVLDYPSDKHEIQILDDSTDETRAIVDERVSYYQSRGVSIAAIRRENRTHYKAGALANGLAQTDAEYVAIFDADFVPQADFLQRLVPLIATQPEVACMQARWGHLNETQTWITRAIALGIDGHFGVEQTARSRADFFLNFNGTAGIWRKSAIDDPRVGGWSGDTITEDLDLSYRAQLVGWKIDYTPLESCPAEIPADVDALKTQQRRWATGSIQCARKLLPRVWRAKLPLITKLEATIHLTQYSVAVYMLLMALVGRTLLWFVPQWRYESYLRASWWIVLIAAAAPTIAYVYARKSLSGRWSDPWTLLRLIALGLGLSVNNAYAVIVGLFQRGGAFVRTPKQGTADQYPHQHQSQSHQEISAKASSSPTMPAKNPKSQRMYAAIRSQLWIAEILAGAFCIFQWAWFLERDHYVGGTFLLFYAAGFLALGLGSLRGVMRARPRHALAERRESPAPALET